MADWSELPPMDQVSFWIGKVSRADSTMEAQMHLAYAELAGPSEGLAWAAVPRMMAGKIEGIRAMLGASGRPVDEIEECRAAVNRVAKAHSDRNALVHGHWSRADDPAQFSRTQAGSHIVAPTVTWRIEEFERLWVRMAEGTQTASALYKRFLRWNGSSLGEAWDLQTREELAGRFTLSNINDEGGGIGSFIRFTGHGIEKRMADLEAVHLAELDRFFGETFGRVAGETEGEEGN